jgi:Family of unknown function (DUF6182)
VTAAGSGSPSQQRLAELFAERAAWAGSGPPPGTAREVTALVLLNRLDLTGLVCGARAFAASLTADEAAAWRWSWTKTRFLWGNPVNLTGRTQARVVGGCGSAAWLGPFPDRGQPGLSRLLRPVTGVLPVLPGVLETAGADDRTPPSRCRELHLAVRGLTLVEYLVHLHHTLAESVLLGRLRPGEPLRLVHWPDIGIAPDGDGYARVHFTGGDQAALRLFAWLAPGARFAPAVGRST